MAYYGEILESGYDPIKENIYSSFTRYFNDPVMTKMKDINGYSMYIAKTDSQLGIEHRYIIVFIPIDGANIGTSEKMSKLNWVSLQTRTLKDDHRLPIHGYFPQRLPELDKKITLTQKDNQQYRYTVKELPLNVVLLPVNGSRGIEYNSSGSLVSALETYQTIVSFV